jgi:signal transduction histidine kinase
MRRRRLERQLHDGAALRISALTLRLGLLHHELPADQQEWQRDITRIQDELHAALQELRDIAAKIYPPLLDEAGLGAALREFADQHDIALDVQTTADRFGPVAEGAAYFAVAEWLTARAGPEAPIRVTVRRDQDDLVMSVAPIQLADVHHLLDHARPLGGVVYPTVQAADSPECSGSTTMRIPCE